MPTSPASGPGSLVAPVGAASLSSSMVNRDGIRRTGLNILAEPFHAAVASSNAVLAGGVAYAMAVGLRAGDVLTNMFTNVITAGAGTAPTLIRQGVCDSAGVMLAVTAQSQASAQWTATGTSTIALTAPLTIAADGLYFLCIIEVGAFGTTPLQLRKCGSGGVVPAVAGGALIAGAQTGLTDLPAVSSSLVLGSASSGHWWLAAN